MDHSWSIPPDEDSPTQIGAEWTHSLPRLHRPHLLLHVSYLGVDPLDQPVDLCDLRLGVFEVIPVLACSGLQLLDL